MDNRKRSGGFLCGFEMKNVQHASSLCQTHAHHSFVQQKSFKVDLDIN
jgi:hypothetical protein